MKVVPPASVAQWTGHHNLWYPTSISLSCPHCTELTTFPLAQKHLDPERRVVMMEGRCPACTERILVWSVDCYGKVEDVKNGLGVLSVHPSPEGRRDAVSGISNVPTRIQRAYMDALRCYNQKLWNPALTCCRRTLEGIVTDQLPQSQSSATLYQKLTDLANHVDLGKPLLELSHAVRESGNLGAHFDDSKDADSSVAAAAIDLLDFFMTYIYLLPDQVDHLKSELDNL